MGKLDALTKAGGSNVAESMGAGGHDSVESDECRLQSPADRDVDCIGCTKVDVKTAQNPSCCIDIGGRDLLPVCRSCDPCIEIGECKLPVFPREVARPHTPPDGRRELGDAEITNDDNLRVGRQKSLGASARRVDDKQCD